MNSPAPSSPPSLDSLLAACKTFVHSVDSLKAFVQKYLDGDVELYIKSEDIPEDNDGPVKVRLTLSLVSVALLKDFSLCKILFFSHIIH